MSFASCGGNEDGTGYANPETLIKIIKVDYVMTYDIEGKIKNIKYDEEHGLTFDQFKTVLSV